MKVEQNMEAYAVKFCGSVWLNHMYCYRSLFAATVIFEVTLTLKGFFVSGQLIRPVEENSSPGLITVTKGSSVWLHWDYTYKGDGTHGKIVPMTLDYKHQLIGFKSTSQPNIRVLAKRIGQNGALTLESPTPAPFNGRVEVIPSNSTLVIHQLQYNDSMYQFESLVALDIAVDGKPSQNVYPLKPTVSLTVNGIPDFISQHPDVLEVNEGSNLSMRIYMDGSPKPLADFNWTHLPTSATTNVSSVQLYPFVYTSTYSLSNIHASYCGRTLQTTIKNSIGSSSAKIANLTVLLNLDQPLGFKVKKVPDGKCVEMKWHKFEAGVCAVRYKVRLKNTIDSFLYSADGINIGEMRICNLLAYDYVTLVKLTVRFKSVYKSVIARVPGRQTVFKSTKNHTKPKFVDPENAESTQLRLTNTWVIITIGAMLLLVVIFTLLLFRCWIRYKSGAHQIQSPSVDKRESRDTEVQARFIKSDLSRAKPVPEYEEII